MEIKLILINIRFLCHYA